VWVETVGEEMLNARKLKQVEHTHGSEWLLNHFLRQRAKYLRQAFALWQKWERDEVSDRLREALHAETSPVQKSQPRSEPEAIATGSDPVANKDSKDPAVPVIVV
jgi:hypothetical protein